MDPLLGLPCLNATNLRCNADLQPLASCRPTDSLLGLPCLNAIYLSCNADLQLMVSRRYRCRLPGQCTLLVRTNCLLNSQPPGFDQLRYQGLSPSSSYCRLSPFVLSHNDSPTSSLAGPLESLIPGY